MTIAEELVVAAARKVAVDKLMEARTSLIEVRNYLYYLKSKGETEISPNDEILNCLKAKAEAAERRAAAAEQIYIWAKKRFAQQ